MSKSIVSRLVPGLASCAALGTMIALCGSSAPTRQSAGSDHTFTATGSGGWQLISAPYNYSQSFQQIGMYTAAWQPAQNSYAVTPAPPADAFHLGQGYWAYLTNSTTLPARTGSADTTQNFSIPLQPGWNMVGDPFTNSIPLTNLYFVDSQTGLSTQFPTAASSNGISPLFSYDPAAGGYTAVSDSSQNVQPWAGYWVYSFHTGSLVVSPASSGGAPPSNAPVTAVTLGSTSASYFTGPMPPPSPSLANPLMSINTTPIQPGQPLTLYGDYNHADELLIGFSDPAIPGFFDLKTAGQPANVYVQAAIAGAPPAAFTLHIQTMQAGAVTGATDLLLKTNLFDPLTVNGCGGGEITGAISDAGNSNVDPSPIQLDYVVGRPASISGTSPCLFQPGRVRILGISTGDLTPFLVAGQSYSLYGEGTPSPSGPPATLTMDGSWAAYSGTLNVVSVVGQTATFTAHAEMQPIPPTDNLPPSLNYPRGSFTLELQGKVAIMGK